MSLAIAPPSLPLDLYVTAAPLFIIALGSIATLMQSITPAFASHRMVSASVMGTLALALAAACFNAQGTEQVFLGGSVLSQSLTSFGSILVLSIALIVSLMFRGTYLADRFFRGEIGSIFLLVVLGMLLMVSADEFITIFIGLELSSIGLYALLGYLQPTQKSLEGAIKYLILGSFATAFLLFGFALLYAQTGLLRISEIVHILPRIGEHPWLRLGGLFVLVGLGFKLALVPFHLWAPDAYEGAPTGITAFMATAAKATIVIIMLRLLTEGLPIMNHTWTAAIAFLAGASMLVGNIMALVQSSLKRLLAYSSIAHSGYMTIAICALSAASGDQPGAAVLYYLLGYTIISLGTFAILMWFESHEIDNIQLDDLANLSHRFPKASLAMAILMFSLAGFPPSVGFISKFFVFSSALDGGLYGLALIGILGSSISVYYYLRVIVKMYMSPPVATGAAFDPTKSWGISVIAGSAIALNLFLGTVGPDSLLAIAKTSIHSLLSK